MEIGYKIKQLRIQKNLTLEELASRSELTKGFLSQLERDLSSPSIATLNDILEALGTTLGDFFQEDDKTEKLVFKEEDFFVDEKDDYTVNWIVPNTQKNEMEPILMEINPKGKSFVVNPHSGEEFGYILEGSVELLWDDNYIYKINKGETFYLKGKAEHIILNKSDKVAKILWVSTPPLF